MGRLIAIRDGMERLSRSEIDEPLISFWFDDGLAGVRKYAAPILAKRDVSGATSICSRFATRIEMFWRFKLSYLHSIGAGPLLRRRLSEYGCNESCQLRSFTIDKFQSGLLAAINEIYDELVPSHVQQEAFKIFDTPEGLLVLRKQGWAITNHSAAHYPIGESHVNDILLEQFEECEQFIRDLTGAASGYWVFPFDRKVDPAAIDQIQQRRPDQAVVLVRGRFNSPKLGGPILYRISPNPYSRSNLQQTLKAASP
jgi:peptidoglycan/xylan/chitin deacetylase (PgdA/CDA1 family)